MGNLANMFGGISRWATNPLIRRPLGTLAAGMGLGGIAGAFSDDSSVLGGAIKGGMYAGVGMGAKIGISSALRAATNPVANRNFTENFLGFAKSGLGGTVARGLGGAGRRMQNIGWGMAGLSSNEAFNKIPGLAVQKGIGSFAGSIFSAGRTLNRAGRSVQSWGGRMPSNPLGGVLENMR